MNTLELEAYKAELAREVLNINNQEVLDTIKDVIRKGEDLTNTPIGWALEKPENCCKILKRDLKKGSMSAKRRWKNFIMRCNNENTIRH